MEQVQDERRQIPVAAEARPVLDYAKPKPAMSIWRLGEIVCRYGFAIGVATIGTVLLQYLCAGLLSGLPRKMQGEALLIPFWLFIGLVVLLPPSFAFAVVWKLLGHPVGRSLVLLWTFAFAALSGLANSSGFYKAWSRGW